MRKHTRNQLEVIECLSGEYKRFTDICELFGIIQNERHRYTRKGYVWESTVNRVLNSLVMRGDVEYKYRGLYRIKTLNN